jgi:hypothetical protein
MTLKKPFVHDESIGIFALVNLIGRGVRNPRNSHRTPAAAFSFIGWGCVCSGTATICILAINAAKNVF